MMLLDSLHISFRCFHIAFVKTVSLTYVLIYCNHSADTFFLFVKEEQDVYAVKTYPDVTTNVQRLLPNDCKVKFRCSEGVDNLPLPDPVLLDCHYRVAEIIHAADLVGHIYEKIHDWRDMKKYGETNGCLCRDGSSNITKILNTALWPAVAE
jgi:hypothetical protein